MKLEIKFTLEFSDTDFALLTDISHQDSLDLNEAGKSEVETKFRRLIDNRKREIGQIIALKGDIDEQVRVESCKLAEARRSPW